MKWKKKCAYVCVKENLSIGHKNWTMKWFKTKKETQQDVELRCFRPQRMSHTRVLSSNSRNSVQNHISWSFINTFIQNLYSIKCSFFCSGWLIMVNNCLVSYSMFAWGDVHFSSLIQMITSGQFNSEPTQIILEIKNEQRFVVIKKKKIETTIGTMDTN